jgi:hypothetical protein
MRKTQLARPFLRDNGALAKRRTAGPTFSELLKQEADSDVEQQPEPQFDEVDQAGRGLVLVNGSAWDDCGSRGWAGGKVECVDDADVARKAAAGPPQLRRKKNHRDANLMEYLREDGRPVVMAEMSVRWADLMY